jgi:TrmH family RNA methyltransferase
MRGITGVDAHKALIQRFREARRDPAFAVLEGFHPLKHALRFDAEIVEAVVVEPERVERLAETLGPDIGARLRGLSETVPPEIFDELSPTPPATGIIALARRPAPGLREALDDAGPAPVVFLERPTSLWNIGAAVRVAAAAGAAGLFTTGTHDPWQPNALRGAAGLQYALPVARIGALPACDRPIIAIDPEGEPITPGAIPPRALLAFGTERHGLTPELMERAERRLAIPMRSGVSSLNLATAVAVVLYAGPGTP